MIDIGVIMPVKYWHRPFLRSAVASVVGQTSPRWRLYVANDGDPSALRDDLSDLLGDERITILDGCGGSMTRAINRAMRASSEGFVAILHGDDMLATEAIGAMSVEAGEGGADFLHSARTLVGDDEKPIPPVVRAAARVVSRHGYVLGNVDSDLYGGMAKHMLCWDREKALGIGGLDEDFGPVGADDYEWPWTCLERGFRFRAVQRPLYVYRSHSLFRGTTHFPLSLHVAETRKILAKHGVADAEIERQIRIRKDGYLRQCLFS